MDKQVNRREKTGSTPQMMTNNSSVGAIIPIAVAEPVEPLEDNPISSDY